MFYLILYTTYHCQHSVFIFILSVRVNINMHLFANQGENNVLRGMKQAQKFCGSNEHYRIYLYTNVCTSNPCPAVFLEH